MNTPRNLADVLAPMLEGKTLVDLGCGDGDFLAYAKRHAARVIGMQWTLDSEDGNTARARGIEVIDGNILDDPWPEADVYYCFTFFHDTQRVIKKHQHGLLVIGGTPAKFANYHESVQKGIILDIPTQNHEEPIWRVALFYKP